MIYTLFDTSSGNRVGTYESRSAAFDAVRREVTTNDDAEDLALEEYDDGVVQVVGEGETLMRMAVESQSEATAW